MSGLDWGKARRDSQRAQERARQRENRPSGQRKPFKKNAKRTTPKQRHLIERLEAELDLSGKMPLPQFAWQASNRIESLLRSKEKRSRAA
jgi:hypothetical protein